MSEWARSINSDGITEAGCTVAKHVVGGESAQSLLCSCVNRGFIFLIPTFLLIYLKYQNSSKGLPVKLQS